MQRIIQVPNATSTYNSTNQRIYTRFHRKPQVYPTSFQTNKNTVQVDTLEEENMNNIITDIYKQKKFRGMLDPTSPNNKNIFIDTDSEIPKSEKIQEEYAKAHNKKSTQLLIAKTESQFPETYNSQNIFKRDGLTKGFYIKANPKIDNNTYNYMNNFQNRNNVVRTVFQTPEPEFDENMIYNYHQIPKTQIRPKKEINNYMNFTDNGNTRHKEQYNNQINREEYRSLEPNTNTNIYYRNKDIQIGINPIKNKLNKNQQFNKGIIYRKNNVSYSKSNISDLSIDNMNQKKQQYNENNNINNFIIRGTGSDIASPEIEFRNISNENDAQMNSDEFENQNEYILYNENDYNNYRTKKMIQKEIHDSKYNTSNPNQGGKVDLYYELMNNKKDSIKRDKTSMANRRSLQNLENMFENDEDKMTSLIKLQRFIKSYLYLRELCAMKIQAVWRGCNTRKIMDLYNNLDEFIYHLSKVQFNHFNNDFCFFIKQLFNIYKANVSNENYNDESNEEMENDENENEMNINNEIYDNEYIQERAYFDPDKLEAENEIALVVEGVSNTHDKKRSSKDYDKLKQDYDDLYQQYNELRANKGGNIINPNTNRRVRQKKNMNEFDLTIGSAKSDCKFRFRTNSRDNTNYRGYSEIRHSEENKEKNSFSNDYDADLDINREDDFFNQEMSYDDKDNSGSPINDKQYNYFSVHSEENSKYFDNENIKEGENAQKSKTIGKYTTKRGKPRFLGINKNLKNSINSPSIGESTNYIGHHSKIFQRNHKDTDDNILIIPKREEEFNIIDNININSSPKKITDVIAITPNDRYLNKNKNWNEINKHIKNEEILIPNSNESEIRILRNKLNEIKNKENRPKIFGNNLEINNNINQINIRGNNPELIQLNNIEIERNRSMSPRIFSKLEPEGILNNRFEVQLMPNMNKLNNNLHIDNINTLKIKKTKLIPNTNDNMTDTLDLISENQNSNRLRNKSQGNSISLRNEINLKGSRKYKYEENNKLDEIIKNDEFSLINRPKREIKIVTKKILKKTNYIHSRFKDNKTLISSQSEFDIKKSIKNRKFNESYNKMTNENMIKLKGIGKKFDNRKINMNTIQSINLEGSNIIRQKYKSIPNKPYENIINKKTQFRIDGKKTMKKENIINKKVTFQIDAVKKDLSEKICDTEDLIPKEIKITTKKIVKKTNVLKPKIKNEISLHNDIKIEGLEEPIMELMNQKEYDNKKKEWNELLREEIQQNKFMIKRISKNLYNTIKDVKELENKVIKNNKENIVDSHININIQSSEKDEIPEMVINKEKDLNKSLKKENVNKNNIIVRKIKLEIISNKYSSQEKPIEKIISSSNNWNESLKEETLHSKFIIRRKRSKPASKEIERNNEIIIEPIDDILISKNKILENWNECNEEEKLEELNIEKQPQQREIKITTKKILKKTNYIYKKFENKCLNVIHNQLNIDGKQKMPSSEYTSENSKININIDKTYEAKRNLDENDLAVLQASEIFINSNDYKKKEIKITTKTSVTKTKFIHKKFKNNYISNENQIFIRKQRVKKDKNDKMQKPLKEFVEQGIQKEDNIDKEEKTTDTLDLEKKEIKITTKKVVKKTNVLKNKFNNNSICENEQLVINKAEKDNQIDKEIIKQINKNKINKENIINKVSQIQLRNDKLENNNYNIIEEEKNQLNAPKLHSKNNKINEEEKSISKGKKLNKNKQLKTVVIHIDQKYDVQNCFKKWNVSTINVPLKNDLKNKNQIKSNLILDNTETISDNKKTNETSIYETINIEDKKVEHKKNKSNNNEAKEGKKRRIKIKYVKNNKDNNNSLNTSKSSENKISINDESNISNDGNDTKTIKYTQVNEIEEENKDMKSLEPKSTKKPFILRINKVEVKKKILKSNSRPRKKDSKEIVNKNIMNLLNSLIIKSFLQKWQKNTIDENNSMKKIVRRFIIRNLAMNKKLYKFKTHLIKYAFKNK